MILILLSRVNCFINKKPQITYRQFGFLSFLANRLRGRVGQRPGTAAARPGTAAARPGPVAVRPGTVAARPGTVVARRGG